MTFPYIWTCVARHLAQMAQMFKFRMAFDEIIRTIASVEPALFTPGQSRLKLSMTSLSPFDTASLYSFTASVVSRLTPMPFS
jgi:hypothetical protein